jgi:hypothetical protein
MSPLEFWGRILHSYWYAVAVFKQLLQLLTDYFTFVSKYRYWILDFSVLLTSSTNGYSSRILCGRLQAPKITKKLILLRAIQFTNVQRNWCSTEKMVFSYKKNKHFMRPIHVWRSRTPDGVRCAHFPNVITTIMNQKVQLLKQTVKRWVVYHVAEPKNGRKLQ